MNFSLKNFLFGLGAGMIIISLLFYCVYSFVGEEDIVEASASLSDEEIEEKAKALGMAFEDELQKPTELAAEKNVLTDEEIVSRAKNLGMAFVESVEGTLEAAICDENHFIIVQIPHGTNAASIVSILKENKVIDDSQGFHQYLTENDATKRVQSGEFRFPANSDFETVLQILLRKSR